MISTATTATFIIWMICSYFIGNFSPSTLIARSKGHDIKKEGSGNAGTTNVLRILGPKYALLTFAMDVFKGWLASFVAARLLPADLAAYCILAVTLGHIFPQMLHFKGGKGVACGVGAISGQCWWMALICFGAFVVVFLISRKVSLGSLCGTAMFPIQAAIFHREMLIPAIITAGFIFFMHRANIARLARGEEKSISLKNKQPEGESK
ncbi:MAG: glycerol-3-phosphate 1-O-acyltransferase PlsY [Eubacterium sp.]|jgi:glycerol-3-phosphate acyltransferase PlsY